MSALDETRRLERMATALARGELPAPADCQAFASVIEKWLDGREPYAGSLEAHLGLALAPSQPDPRRVRRAQQRDSLCAEALRLLPGSALARATALHGRLTCADRSREWSSPRCQPAETLDALVRDIVRWGTVLSVESLRRLAARQAGEIGHRPPLSTPNETSHKEGAQFHRVEHHTDGI